MAESFSFAEIDGQHVELLPSRTVMSMLKMGGECRGGNGGTGGAGGDGEGGLGINLLNIDVIGDQKNSAADGTGGAGGSANGGNCNRN